MNFLSRLRAEFKKRQSRNIRYSLRAFARDLGTDHATLSQILRGRRRLSPRMVRHFGVRLRLEPALIIDFCVQQNAEAILQLVGAPGFRPSGRWLAARSNIPLDSVNTALHRLVSSGDLVMQSTNSWIPTRSPYA